jgi:VWFA-related protein
VVDVVVRDRHNHLVTDLTANDFEVYEDGVKQKIGSFSNIQGRDQQPPANTTQTQAAAAAPSSAAGIPLNDMRELHFVTIVVGDIAPDHLKFARDALDNFLKTEVVPNTYITILRADRRLSILQPFTNEKSALLQAAQRATTLHSNNLESPQAVANSEAMLTTALNAPTGPEAGPPTQSQYQPNDPLNQRLGPMNTAQLTEATLADSLRFATEYVNGMTSMSILREVVRSQARLQGRKLVLFLADGLPIPASRPEMFVGLISDANRTGVTFYTFDTKGLFVADNPLITPATQGIAQLNRAVSEGGGAGNALQKGSMQGNPSAAFNAMSGADDLTLVGSSNPELTMQELAERTGGFATTSTNNIVDPMRRVVEDIGTHYELSYTPTSSNYDGRFRKIDVKVDRPKVTIEARRGYFALPEINGEPIQPFELAALNAINARPQPRAVPYRSELLTFRPGQTALQCAVAFEVPLSNLTAQKDAKTGDMHVRTALMALIQDDNGQVVRRIGREMVRNVPAAQWSTAQKQSIIYAEAVSLAPGRYTLSTAVVDNAAPAGSEKSGAKRIAEIIEPAHDLSLSSVQLVERVDPLTAPANPLDPFEMGNKRLTFTLTDTVPAGKPAPVYFVIYPASKSDAAPQLFLQLFKDGKEVARSSPQVPKPDASGAIPVYAELSPPAGSYDLRVTVKQGSYVAQKSRLLTIE